MTAPWGDPLVEGVTTAVYTVPTDGPEADGTLAWNSTTLVLVSVRSGDATGLGWTYGAPATADVVAGQLAPAVTGRSAWDVPGAQEAMGRAVRNAGRPGLIAGAVSAVDIALWDLKARLLDLPLVQLLGACRQDVPVYGSGGFTTYDDAQQDRQLRGWTEELGIPRAKIKIGEAWGKAEERDRHRITRARKSIGDGVELYVDANGAYTRKQAVRIARHLDAEGVTWFEEPVSSDDLAGLAQIRAAVAMDVAAGEYGYTLPYFGHMLAAGAVDCLQADATRCGGITVWLRAAALAEAAGLELSGHCAPHAHAHAAAAVPNMRHLEWFHDHTRIEALLFDGTLGPAAGSVRPGADGSPGHGLTLNAERADPYRVR
ncbi:enolase C-terminal domain-like protein [Streptomyces morookaense]|uniref:Mandelate racemase n=1 Tax=Streptomyces morookaense TaxID=1970 RepID=A0A7Y7AZZ0_STRMO|nr:enolase C-terminal domain-like protein [Streptomyces morookaense]NVK76498.1 mandelate racemase [Streptomyces morookaense]GHF07556.1 mandelate racemase [Streptomyces morookaense]